MGRVTLAAGKLEAELIRLLARSSVPEKLDGLSLGKLITIASKYGVLDKNEIRALKEVCGQRNYLTHNIYALFIDLIEETGLERSNLLDSDVHTYIERAWQLKEDLLGLAEIVERHLRP